MTKHAMRHHDGLAAERSVARHYVENGYRYVAHRVRLGRTDIDLIMQRLGELVFIEVKKSKTHDRAVRRVTQSQTARLFEAIALYMDGRTETMRVDVSTVDAMGRVEVLENAFA